MANNASDNGVFGNLRSAQGSGGQTSSAFLDYGASHQRNGWMSAAYQQLAQLLELKRGWDGYQGSAISEDTAIFTFQLLYQIWSPDFPVPDISPMSDGGIMLEWLTNNYELTIEIEAPFSVEYLFECLAEGTAQEGKKTQDFSRLNDFAGLIAEAIRDQNDQAA